MSIRKIKKPLAMLLAMVIVLGLLPVSAMASTFTPEQLAARNQIVDEGEVTFWNKDGSKVTSANPALGKDNAVVSVSKMAAPVLDENDDPIENEFEITLQVQTTVDVENVDIDVDAAVVLVMDVSGSMQYTVDSTSTTGTYPQETNYQTYKNGTSRMAKAKVAARDFVDSYMKNATGARWISIVSFGSTAQLVQDWVDLTQEGALTTIRDKIDGLKAPTSAATFLQGGLILARNLYSTGKAPKNGTDAVENRFVVALTDGNPTYYNSTATSNVRTVDNAISGSPYSGTSGQENDANVKGCREYAAGVAAQIRTGTTISGTTFLSAETYTIALSTSSTTFSTGISDSTKTTAAQWLQKKVAFKDASAYAYAVADAGKLSLAFEGISLMIARKASAWTVRDKMGNHIIWDSSNVLDGDTQSFIANELMWNIKDSSATSKTVGSLTVYTYEYSYKVRLDNLYDGFTSSTALYTNGETTLTYVYAVTTNGTTVTSSMYTADFSVPRVRGFTADFKLEKLAKVGNTPLSYAAFTLAPAAEPGSTFVRNKEVVGELGLVSFDGIPSGRTYLLNETAVESPYTTALGQGYTVSIHWGEVTVRDSEGRVVPLNNGAYTIYNDLDEGERDITIRKVWHAAPGATHGAGEITLTGVANAETDQEKTVTRSLPIGGNQLAEELVTFTKLPIRDPETGNEYVYSFDETVVPYGYHAVVDLATKTVTNTRVGTRDLTVTKLWVFPEGTEVDYPVTITVTALGTDGKTYTKTGELSEGQDTVTISVPAFDENGQPLTYTASDSHPGYGATSAVENGGSVTLSNVMDNSKVTISGSKIWKDGNSTAARPEFITIALYSDGRPALDGNSNPITTTTSAAAGWEFSFPGLPEFAETKNASGDVIAMTRIEYSVRELDESSAAVADGGMVTYGSNTYRATYGANNTITNTRTGDSDGDTVTIPVSKNWVPAPEEDSNLFAWVYVTGGDQVSQSKKLHSGNDWTETFTMPKYNANGVAIDYQAVEDECSPGFTLRDTAGNMNSGFVLTNVYSSENRASVSVTKTWLDDGEDGTTAARPKMTFTLWAYSGLNPAAREVDSKELVNPAVQLSFTNLPRYEYEYVVDVPAHHDDELDQDIPEQGHWEEYPILYTVEESFEGNTYEWVSTVRTPADDPTESDGTVAYAFTNRRVGTVSFTVDKVWVKPAGVTAPASVAFTLMPGDVKQIWTGSRLTFGGLNKYDDDGLEISYTITEENVPNYAPTYAWNGNALTVTNTMGNTSFHLSGSKQWISAGAATPDEIYVKVVGSDGNTYGPVLVKPNAENGTFTFPTELPNYVISGTPAGSGDYTPITYALYECDSEGNVYDSTGNKLVYDGVTYEVSYGAGNAITNKRVQQFIEHTITKYWIDPAGTEHPEATFTLYQSEDGGNTWAEYAPKTTWTTTLGDTSAVVTHTFENLPYFNESRGATYSYKAIETGAPAGYTASVDPENATVFYNTVKQADVTIGGNKIWAGDVSEGQIPDSIQVAIFRGLEAEPIATIPVTPGNDNSWAYTYTVEGGMYGVSGERIVYSVKEVGVDANGQIVYREALYTVSYGDVTADSDGNLTANITNTYERPFIYQYELRTYYRTLVYDVEYLDGIETGRVLRNPADLFVRADDQWYYGRGSENQTVSLDSILSGDTTAIAAKLGEFASYTGFDAVTGETGVYTHKEGNGTPEVQLSEEGRLYEISHYFERVIEHPTYYTTYDGGGVLLEKEGKNETILVTGEAVIPYTLTVRNMSNKTMSSVVVTDTFQTEGMQLDEASVIGADFVYNAESGTITFTVPGTIAAGASHIIYYSVKVTAAGIYENTAVVTAVAEDADEPVEGGSEEKTNVTAPDLGIVKTIASGNPADASVTANGNITFTFRLTVVNNGQVALNDLVVTDVMGAPTTDATMVYSSDDPAFDADTQTWTIGTLEPGEKAELIYSVTVSAEGTYTNVAIVDGTYEDEDHVAQSISDKDEYTVTVTRPVGGGDGDDDTPDPIEPDDEPVIPGPGEDEGEVDSSEVIIEEIEEEELALANLPDLEEKEEAAVPPEEFELIDEDLPMGNLPQTGTMAEFGASGLSLMAALSMAAAGLGLLSRKKEEEN